MSLDRTIGSIFDHLFCSSFTQGSRRDPFGLDLDWLHVASIVCSSLGPTIDLSQHALRLIFGVGMTKPMVVQPDGSIRGCG